MEVASYGKIPIDVVSWEKKVLLILIVQFCFSLISQMFIFRYSFVSFTGCCNKFVSTVTYIFLGVIDCHLFQVGIF